MKGTRIRAQRSDALRDEAAWIPRTFDELQELRQRLTDAGHSSPIVNGLTGWLVSKALGEEDTTGSSTRASYRRILRELEDVDPDDPKRYSLPHRASSRPPIIIVGRSRVLSGAGARAWRRLRAAA